MFMYDNIVADAGYSIDKASIDVDRPCYHLSVVLCSIM